MAVYDNELMKEDLRKTARTLHAAIRRAEFCMQRWNNGPGASIPNSGATAKWHNMATRCQELVTDMTAGGNAKLNTVLAVSDLNLPGDA